MEIYWYLLCLMLSVNFLPINKTYCLFLSFIPFFLYGALRVDYGYDYVLNESTFDNIHQYGIDYEAHQEIGYQILCLVCSSFRTLIVFTSAFTTLCFVFFIKEFVPSKFYFLAIILLFLAGDKLIFFQFSAIRNAIAIDLMLVGIILYNRKIKILYILIVFILATFFHTSAIIFIPLLVLFFAKVNYTYKFSIFFLIGIMGVRMMVGSPYVRDYISWFLIGNMERYSEYLDEINLTHGASFFMWFFMLIYTSLVLGVLVKCGNILERKVNLITRLSLSYSFAMALGPLGFRANQYYAFLFILMPLVLLDILNLNKKIRYGLFSIISVYLLYAFTIIFLKSDNFPYQEYHCLLE